MLHEYFGVDAIVRILSHLLFIYLAFWALQSIRLDMLFKKGQHHQRQIKCMYLFLAVLLGYTASCFLLEFLSMSRNAAVFG